MHYFTSWQLLIIFALLPVEIYPLDGSCFKDGISHHTERQIKNILKQILHWQKEDVEFNSGENITSPFVTLTYAQSIDGKIALSDVEKDGLTSSNLPMSGPESLLMTHALRSIHDAILIGGKTLSIDNPRLTNRLWGDSETRYKQPRPVVLDAELRHLKRLGKHRKAMNLIVCCSEKAAASAKSRGESSTFHVDLLPCRCKANGWLDIEDVVQKLYEVHGIKSIMVEGGASVINEFEASNNVDCLCITIAPKLFGDRNGLSAFATLQSQNTKGIEPWIEFKDSSCRFWQLGPDCIFLGRWES